MRFEQKSSQLDSTEYAIIGYSAAKTITAYSGKQHVLAFMRSKYNGHSDPTAFERLVLSRQGGAVIKIFGAEWGQAHWPKGVYKEFVEWLEESYHNKRKQWEEMSKRRGWDADMFEKMDPIPKPMYFDGIRNLYKVEPWFLEEEVKASSPHNKGA
jgi:hypothetical protein